MAQKPLIIRKEEEMLIHEVNLKWSDDEIIDFILKHLKSNKNLKNTNIKEFGDDRLKHIEESLILLEFVESKNGELSHGASYDELYERSMINLSSESKKILLRYGNYLKYLKVKRQESRLWFLDAYGSVIGGVSGLFAFLVSAILAYYSICQYYEAKQEKYDTEAKIQQIKLEQLKLLQLQKEQQEPKKGKVLQNQHKKL